MRGSAREIKCVCLCVSYLGFRVSFTWVAAEISARCFSSALLEAERPRPELARMREGESGEREKKRRREGERNCERDRKERKHGHEYKQVQDEHD